MTSLDVGSVGTRSWIALLIGRDTRDPLFLQIKEAEASVLEPFLGRSEFSEHGRRVVTGQHLMQADSDICLGWLRAHARTGDPIASASYLGDGDAFDRAILDFSTAYADQNKRDHEERQGRGVRSDHG